MGPPASRDRRERRARRHRCRCARPHGPRELNGWWQQHGHAPPGSPSAGAATHAADAGRRPTADDLSAVVGLPGHTPAGHRRSGCLIHSLGQAQVALGAPQQPGPARARVADQPRPCGPSSPDRAPIHHARRMRRFDDAAVAWADSPTTSSSEPADRDETSRASDPRGVAHDLFRCSLEGRMPRTMAALDVATHSTP